jgi:hypothetical protein
VLRDVVDRLGDRRVAKHARVPLGLAVAEPAKVLSVGGGAESVLRSASARGGAIRLEASQPERAEGDLKTALLNDADVAAESLGHVDYKLYVDELTDLLEAQGKVDEAAAAQKTLYSILAARSVLPRVLEEIEKRRQALEGAAKPYKKGREKTVRTRPPT